LVAVAAAPATNLVDVAPRVHATAVETVVPRETLLDGRSVKLGTVGNFIIEEDGAESSGLRGQRRRRQSHLG
jgi:hypothetical protein